MTTASTTAVIYARFSTNRQDPRSLEDQERRCREFAQRNGYHVAKVFSDEAVSGTHDDRPQLQQMLKDVELTKGKAFNRVLVDDLSRLSRNVGQFWDIVFNELESSGIVVTDVLTGMSSDNPAARQLFGVITLGNDFMVQQTRARTMRGLEGRALAGFWTGGRVYGYQLVKEKDPPSNMPPRTLLVVDVGQAAVVRRIFESFDEGMGMAAIASQLNDEGVPAPYDSDGGGLKKRGSGWQMSTVRAMLMNERYVGRCVWNKRKHLHKKDKRHREARQNPPELWKVNERPELAIIEKDLWDKVRARFALESRGRGRPSGSSRQYVHLLSGILRCGDCSSPLGITGSKKKAGVTYFMLGCTRRHTRGETMCGNALRISENKAQEFIFSELRERLTQPGVIEEVVAEFLAEAKKPQAQVPSAAGLLQRQIAETERRVSNFSDALGKMGYSASLHEKLDTEEKRLADLKAKAAALAVPVTPAKLTLPPLALIEDYIDDLLATLQSRPEEAKALLKAHLGEIIMVPKREGPRRFYEATGAFHIRVPIPAIKSRRLENNVAGARVLNFQPGRGPVVSFSVVIPVGRCAA